MSLTGQIVNRQLNDELCRLYVSQVQIPDTLHVSVMQDKNRISEARKAMGITTAEKSDFLEYNLDPRRLTLVDKTKVINSYGHYIIEINDHEYAG